MEIYDEVGATRCRAALGGSQKLIVVYLMQKTGAQTKRVSAALPPFWQDSVSLLHEGNEIGSPKSQSRPAAKSTRHVGIADEVR